MIARRALVAAAALALAGPAGALTLELPGKAHATRDEAQPMASYALPIGAWADGTLPARETEGAVSRNAWRLDTRGMTTLQLLAPLRDQLAGAGYRVLFECETDRCGGFDFRYATSVFPEPDMHVDLGDFRFLAAEKPGQTPEFVSLMVSRSSAAGYVQLTHVGPAGPATTVVATPSTKTPLAAPDKLDPAVIATALETSGRAALDDLTFASGSATLGAGKFDSLLELAAFLKANPDRHVTLVGHTDATGDLGANIALSRQRALSVRAHLINDYDVPASQVGAEGAGYLAPRASNLTDDGRQKNRRVEVMLTSTR